jgi:hypothetical protein
MGYRPTVSGFFKAVFDTLRGKKLKPKIFDDSKPGWTMREIYENYSFSYGSVDKEPTEEWWKERLMEKIEAMEREEELITKMMIEDYERRHAEDSDETEEADSEGREANGDETGEDIRDADYESSADSETDAALQDDVVLDHDETEGLSSGEDVAEIETDGPGNGDFDDDDFEDGDSDFDDGGDCYGYIG